MSDLCTHHFNSIHLELMYKKPSDEKIIFPFLSVFCFLCYSSGNRFNNLKSLRWHADDLLFIPELRQWHCHHKNCHPLIWCCAMKRLISYSNYEAAALSARSALISSMSRTLSMKPEQCRPMMGQQAHTFVIIHCILHRYGCLKVKGQTALQTVTPVVRSNSLVGMDASHPSHLQTKTRTNAPSPVL